MLTNTPKWENIAKWKWGAGTESSPNCWIAASLRCSVSSVLRDKAAQRSKGITRVFVETCPPHLLTKLPQAYSFTSYGWCSLTIHQLLRSQFPANISHLTQTFPPGYLCCCQYVPDANEVALCDFRRLSPRRVNQKLPTDSTQHRYRSLGGKEKISLLGILWLICVRLSQQSPDWQAIQLSGSEKERKTIIISITSPSPAFLRRSFALMI